MAKVEFDIARRLSDRRGGAKAGIMERVATIATAVKGIGFFRCFIKVHNPFF